MDDVDLAFRLSGGVLRRQDHPRLAGRLDRRLARGRIAALLPGILTDLDPALPEVRLAAGLLWAGPDAVLAGAAAARLTFWPDAALSEIELCRRSRGRARPGWRITERVVPAELRRFVGRAVCTAPALTAVDLCAGRLGGNIIDRALRTRAATLVELWRALELCPNRRGNERRHQLLLDSRDEPWSEAERELHRLLRTAGISGWHTNVPVGRYLVDVGFDRIPLVLEVDGYEFHSSRSAFERDRRRLDELLLSGHLVLTFTWAQVIGDPDWVIGCVRRALDGQPQRKIGGSSADAWAA